MRVMSECITDFFRHRIDIVKLAILVETKQIVGAGDHVDKEFTVHVVNLVLEDSRWEALKRHADFIAIECFGFHLNLVGAWYPSVITRHTQAAFDIEHEVTTFLYDFRVDEGEKCVIFSIFEVITDYCEANRFTNLHSCKRCSELAVVIPVERGFDHVFGELLDVIVNGADANRLLAE